MKRITYILSLLAVILCTTSCEKDLPVYDTETCRINFNYDYKTMNSDMLETYSFVYHGDITQDTVWVKVNTMGFLSDEDRYFELQQVEVKDTLNAVPGKHYVAFDDMKKYYYIPAGANTATVPVVLLRDASLQSAQYLLKFELKETDNFKKGYDRYNYRKIYFTDQIAEPTGWLSYGLYYYIGLYTTGLHRFIIDVTGEKWDDDYITSACSDQGFLYYIGTWLKNKLDEVNAERAAQGLDPLMNDDGTPVVVEPFTHYTPSGEE